ncbi:MAG: hypothetical protein U5M23_12570 [Marinagarivorans sp.]|nr:hypothetical protein [Marinagarivorans sp.]
MFFSPVFIATFLLFFANSSHANSSLAAALTLPEVPVNQRTPVSNSIITNLEAPIPSQCYTKTESRHNPCYTCHQIYDRSKGQFRMNELDDGGLQGMYIFSDDGLSNHWKNLFVDRQDWLASVSDEAIQTYVNRENYSQLAPTLTARKWQGFIPDLANFDQAERAFDQHGVAKDGSHWIAFNYKPFPGTFWPTNGATDDVVIRLPKAYREDKGQYHQTLYFLNLALVELNIKQLATIAIASQDEKALKIDLDGDGKLGTATQLIKRSHYLGDASQSPVVAQQYPEDTEFMHSVRYVGSEGEGNIFVPARMKELRYMKKIRALAQYDVASRYARERKEKQQGQLPNFNDHGERGMENGFGWMLQGYIEDYDGTLRPQSHEETFFCMGCHAAVGATIDQTFAFARKITGPRGWGYIDLKNMPDARSVSESGGEILHYLQRAGGGSEFRENPEMLARWFKADGSVDANKVAAADVYSLITPSHARAMQLNKAYAHIVRHQSFIDGRDATWLPARNVFATIDESTPPLAPEFRFYDWDIRLDWSQY